ncbi:MAG TPA: 7-carboxy-7-deazaguanine synthase QueE [Kineosporiaceae bacterium]
MSGGTDLLRVAELFGPTLQGEGPSTGRHAVFVRLSGCNLSCSWCDTPYTWDWSRFDRSAESQVMPAEDVGAWVAGIPAELVVITGGEPLLQHRPLGVLLARLTASGRRVEIETNGTVPPPRAFPAEIVYNVSPKLGSSGVPRARRLRPAALRDFRDTGRAVFKFVVADEQDLAELCALERDCDLSPVWVMPEGITRDDVLAGLSFLADHAVARGWNLACRLHTLLWGDTRGR